LLTKRVTKDHSDAPPVRAGRFSHIIDTILSNFQNPIRKGGNVLAYSYINYIKGLYTKCVFLGLIPTIMGAINYG